MILGSLRPIIDHSQWATIDLVHLAAVAAGVDAVVLDPSAGTPHYHRALG